MSETQDHIDEIMRLTRERWVRDSLKARAAMLERILERARQKRDPRRIILPTPPPEERDNA